MELAIGSIITGKITGITNFGAFVSLPGGRSGMVHISEVSHTYVENIKEHLSEGQEVTVKVLEPDKNGRINLSIKKAMPNPGRTERKTAPPPSNRGRGPLRGDLTFEDKLKQFMQDSDAKPSADSGRGDRRPGKKNRRSNDFYDEEY